MNRKRVGKKDQAGSSWKAKGQKSLVDHSMTTIQQTIDELGWTLEVLASIAHATPCEDAAISDGHSAHLPFMSLLHLVSIAISCVQNVHELIRANRPSMAILVAEEGPKEKPGSEIENEDWSKVDQTLQDLEKNTKQGELLLMRQEEKSKSKELEDLIKKLEEVIVKNKEVEVHLEVVFLPHLTS